jgi:hypothetical protein
MHLKPPCVLIVGDVLFHYQAKLLPYTSLAGETGGQWLSYHGVLGSAATDLVPEWAGAMC